MIPLVPPLTLIMQLITPNRARARRAPTAVQATADAIAAAAAALYSKKAKRGAD